jgi:cytochrome c
MTHHTKAGLTCITDAAVDAPADADTPRARTHALHRPRVARIALTVLLAAGATGALAQADAKRGEKVFEECRACHGLEPGVHNVGPSLAGLLGRKTAANDHFRFSPALRRSNLTWNRQTLDAFVADPQKVVPANRMPYSGLPDAKDRADLIACLVLVAK